MPDILTKADKPLQIECQFCDFRGNAEEGAWHRKTTGHLIRVSTPESPQSAQRLSEAVPDAKTGVQSDSGAGIGLPEPPATPETRIRWLLTQIMWDLPANRDWLDPAIEAEAREVTGVKKVAGLVAAESNEPDIYDAVAELRDTEAKKQTTPKTIRISLPALRALILAALDDKVWLFYEKYQRDGNVTWTETLANEDRLRFCDLLIHRLRQLPARG